LPCNTLPTGAILVVLITVLGPISGAHFNPAVTLVFAVARQLPVKEAVVYAIAQIAGGIAGTIAALFALPVIDLFREGADRRGAMVCRICGGLRSDRNHPRRAPLPTRGGRVAAAYWFTASPSFANPAVAIARSLTNRSPASARSTCRDSSSPSPAAGWSACC
jgi:glycerol uptake facilitator-like aquaporin